tara:strand:- start:218 stop:412 length:195 start_codon:yes stop_codon:yes gene_type:complete
MATHAQLAAKLLRDAGSFFRNVGEQNPPLKDQMNDNADVYDQVAALVEGDPTGELEVQDQPEQK